MDDGGDEQAGDHHGGKPQAQPAIVFVQQRQQVTVDQQDDGKQAGEPCERDVQRHAQQRPGKQRRGNTPGQADAQPAPACMSHAPPVHRTEEACNQCRVIDQLGRCPILPATVVCEQHDRQAADERQQAEIAKLEDEYAVKEAKIREGQAIELPDFRGRWHDYWRELVVRVLDPQGQVLAEVRSTPDDAAAANGNTYEDPIIQSFSASGCGPATLTTAVLDSNDVIGGQVLSSASAAYYYYSDGNSDGIANDSGSGWSKVRQRSVLVHPLVRDTARVLQPSEKQGSHTPEKRHLQATPPEDAGKWTAARLVPCARS